MSVGEIPDISPTTGSPTRKVVQTVTSKGSQRCVVSPPFNRRKVLGPTRAKSDNHLLT